jgi:methyl-accepting chemotaxis protein
MNIRIKLFLLVLGMIILFSGAACVYFVNMAPIARIEAERKTLDDLANSIRSLQIELHRLDSSAFALQRPRFEATTTEFNEAFKRLGKIEYLRKSDAELSEAIDIVGQLQKLNEENVQKVGDAYAAFSQDIAAVYVFPDSITARRAYVTDPTSNVKAQTKAIILLYLSRFDFAESILSDSLEASSKILAEQSGVIAARIAAIRTRTILFSAAAIGALIAFAGAVSIAAANSIAKNVIAIANGVNRLRDGDLSVSFDAKGKDEVVTLSRGMNEFMRALGESVLGIQDAAKRNSRVRDQLKAADRRTGESLEQLRGAVHDVEAHTERLDDRIGETKKSVQLIAGGVGALDERITDQIAMVEESTASITQMLATIGNMARLAEQDCRLADGLVRISDSGREVFLATFEKIEAINQQVGKIEEMIHIIDTIAGQTNLLAMNAAIEAAHAGDSGRGFAVVADEILKLAEASAAGSREIAEAVRLIVDAISSARSLGAETNKAIDDITSSVHDVSRSVSQISSSLAETDTGGRGILTAMISLRELSSSVSSESRSVAAGALSISGSMEALDEVSAIVRDAMSNIGRRSDDISETVRRTSGLDEELSFVGSDLEERIARFKISSESDDETIPMDGVRETGKSANSALAPLHFGMPDPVAR